MTDNEEEENEVELHVGENSDDGGIVQKVDGERDLWSPGSWSARW